MKIKMINESSNPMPEYKTSGSSGMDLRAYIPKDYIILQSGQRVSVSTGLYIELPQGYEAQVRSRSGLSIKNGVVVLNAPGTVDSDYRGEICVILMNMGDEEFIIHNGDRIAQLVIAPVVQVEIEEVLKLGETERGSGGFGHTGIK